MSAAYPWVFYILYAVLLFAVAGPAALALVLYYLSPLPLPADARRQLEWIILMEWAEIPVAVSAGFFIAWLLMRRKWVEITSEAVVAPVAWRKVRKPWPEIDVVEQDDLYIYLSSAVSFSGWNLYSMVPKRAFSSLGEAHTFYEEARKYWVGPNFSSADPPEDAWPPAPKVNR